jgi:hypothetical protein
LDGSPSKNIEGLETLSVARWQGASLIISTQFADSTKGTDVLKRVVRLAPDGTMIVETSWPSSPDVEAREPQINRYKRGGMH